MGGSWLSVGHYDATDLLVHCDGFQPHRSVQRSGLSLSLSKLLQRSNFVVFGNGKCQGGAAVSTRGILSTVAGVVHGTESVWPTWSLGRSKYSYQLESLVQHPSFFLGTSLSVRIGQAHCRYSPLAHSSYPLFICSSLHIAIP